MVTETKKIALLGGDGRFLRLAELLAADGAEVCAYALGDALPDCAVRCASISDAVAGADAVLLPVPYSRDGTPLNAPLHPEPVPLDALLAHATDGLPIFGGMLPKGGFPGCVCLDYYSERMQIRNAVPSAEGALMIALERMPGTLHGLSLIHIFPATQPNIRTFIFCISRRPTERAPYGFRRGRRTLSVQNRRNDEVKNRILHPCLLYTSRCV